MVSPQPRSLSRPLLRLALGVAIVALLLSCGGDDDVRFATPAATFTTYREALNDGDDVGSWACLSAGFRQIEFHNEVDRWSEHLIRSGPALKRQVMRLEINQETEINQRLGFLQFDPSTVSQGQGPFYYFLRESGGWKITTHLDSLFRVELEAAIERGEFTLPATRR